MEVKENFIDKFIQGVDIILSIPILNSGILGYYEKSIRVPNYIKNIEQLSIFLNGFFMVNGLYYKWKFDIKYPIEMKKNEKNEWILIVNNAPVYNDTLFEYTDTPLQKIYILYDKIWEIV